MSNVTPFCIFCKNTKSASYLKSFSKETLVKCTAILSVRKTNKLSGHEAVLPTEKNNFQLYHSECYRRFTALPPKYRKIIPEDAPTARLQPEENVNPVAGTSGITDTSNALSGENVDLSEVNLDLPDTDDVGFATEPEIAPENNHEIVCPDNSVDESPCICFFCGKSRKKIKGREDKLSVFGNGLITIQNLAIKSNDMNMVDKIQNLPPNKELFFHKYCKNNYITSEESIIQQGKEKGEWHSTRNIRAEAYDVVEKFVTENIINQKLTFFLKFLNDMFVEHLKKNKEDVSNYTYKPYHLKEKLLKKFPRKINIISFKGQSLVKPFIFHRIMTPFVMIQNETEKQHILETAACILNEEIRKIQPQKLPNQIKTKDLIAGECEVPETLINFYTKLISGDNYRRRQNDRTKRLAKSFSEDMIYAVFNGRNKLSKRICLGLTLKSLTNRITTDDDDENITADSDSDNESERDGCDSSQREAEND